MNEKFTKLKELLTNEESAKKLLALSPEEATHVLSSEYGLSFTVDELNDIVLGIKDSVAEKEGGELSADDLDQVAGGGKGSDAYNFGRSVGGSMPAAFILITLAVVTHW